MALGGSFAERKGVKQEDLKRIVKEMVYKDSTP